MFIKTTKSRNHTYLQIVESYRMDGKVKHKVLLNLGRLDVLRQDRTLETIGRKLLTLSGMDANSISDMKEVKRLCYGHVVYEKIWEKLGLATILDKVGAKHRRLGFSLSRVTFYMAIHRLLRCKSKLRAYQDQIEFKGMDSNIELHQLYRNLDWLATHKEEIEQGMFKRYCDLFNSTIDVAFYDVTTFHFESVRPDELKDFGFSKNGKFNEVQVVMGLFTDQQGRPIGYELFPGNTSDGKTMIDALNILKDRFNINQVVIVADKGLNSKNNFHLIRQAGYEYIVSSKLKVQAKPIQDQVWANEGYHNHEVDKDTAEVLFRYKSVDLEVSYKDEQGQQHEWKDKLIISWSKQRAVKDQKDRKRQVEKAEAMVDQGQVPSSKKGAKRYVKIEYENKTPPTLDEERIKEDSKWDGYYGIQSSRKDMSEFAIMKAYHNLWRIEESFRILKTTMKTRPIFHWTPNRIKGHFVVCFISFAMERALEETLRSKEIEISPEKIKDELNQLQVSQMKLEDHKFYVKGANGQYGAKILRALNIAPLKNIELIQ